ncbi:hypothetical protein [Tsuneonella sp. HG222]
MSEHLRAVADAAARAPGADGEGREGAIRRIEEAQTILLTMGLTLPVALLEEALEAIRKV